MDLIGLLWKRRVGICLRQEAFCKNDLSRLRSLMNWIALSPIGDPEFLLQELHEPRNEPRIVDP